MSPTTTTLIVAPLLSKSGYGVHARSLIENLVLNSPADWGEVHVHNVNWGNNENYAPEELSFGTWYNLVTEKTKELLEKKHVFTYLIQVGLPDEVQPLTASKLRILSTAGVECTKIPPHWVEAMNQNVHLVHVPSQYTANIFKANGVKTPVVIGNLTGMFKNWPSQDDAETQQFMQDLDTQLEPYDDLYITGGQWALTTPVFEDRKALDDTIVAFAKAFSGRKDVVLLVKTHGIMPSDWRDGSYCATRLRELTAICEQHSIKMPKVILLTGFITERQWFRVLSHEKRKAFVSLTHGEGYGLMLAEAANALCPIIATANAGGYTDFPNLTTIKSKLTDVSDSFAQTPWGNTPGAKWFTADAEDAVKVLSNFKRIERATCLQSLGQWDAKTAATWDDVRKAITDLVPEIGRTEQQLVNELKDTLNTYYNSKFTVISDLLPHEGRGAEATLKALIDDAGMHDEVTWMTPAALQEYTVGAQVDGTVLIIGNASSAPAAFWQWLRGTKQTYILMEFDYRWCPYRNPRFAQLDDQFTGYQPVLIESWKAVYEGAAAIGWMSEEQKNVTSNYLGLQDHPFHPTGVVVGSYLGMTDREWQFAEELAEHRAKTEQSLAPACFWNSKDPIKGAMYARAYNYNNYGTVGTAFDNVVSRAELLNLLASHKAFTFLPTGLDTDPRIVIEAVIAGCIVATNDNVQGASADMFKQLAAAVSATERTQVIKHDQQKRLQKFLSLTANVALQSLSVPEPISAYCTTFNLIQGRFAGYFAKSVASFASNPAIKEVVIADLGSEDDSLAFMQEMIDHAPIFEHQRDKIRIVSMPEVFDKSKPNWFVTEGKAEAAAQCKYDAVIQFDIDEVLVGDLGGFAIRFPKTPGMVFALPMIEYWGSENLIRSDYMPFKARLYRRSHGIKHGVPNGCLWTAEDGYEYIKNGAADGCELLNPDGMPALTLRPLERAEIKYHASRDPKWFLANLLKFSPVATLHLSWLDIDKKLHQYKESWDQLHRAKYGLAAEHNAHFNVPWSEVTDEMFAIRALELKLKGSRMFHQDLPKHEVLAAPIFIAR